MSQSLLFFGGNKEIRKEKIFQDINVKSPDVLVIERDKEKKSIGIAQTREGIEFLQEKPFELDKKYLLIPEANLLTTEAQNSILKTLEEPPSYVEIRLGSKTEKDLLDTVVSRCKKINLHTIKENIVEETREIDTYEYLEFKKSTIGERLDIIEELAKEEREDIMAILEKWISEERKLLLKNKRDNTYPIETLTKVLRDLSDTNMNTKFLLEYIALNI